MNRAIQTSEVDDFRPSAEPSRPPAEAVQWWLGYTLALAGIEASPPRDLPESLRAAFVAGQDQGEFDVDADLDAMAIESAVNESNADAFAEAMEMDMEAYS